MTTQVVLLGFSACLPVCLFVCWMKACSLWTGSCYHLKDLFHATAMCNLTDHWVWGESKKESLKQDMSK